MYSKEIEQVLKKGKITPGNYVHVANPNFSSDGVLIPRPNFGDESILVIKLANGYNVGIRYDAKTKIIKLNKVAAKFSFPENKLKFDKSKPKVTLITTGGTIGSKVDYRTGGVHMLLKPEELLYDVPELSRIANVEVNNLFSIASEDMGYKQWQDLAKGVESAFENGSRGVVIFTGTDTMHYISSALSFMLERLNGPVVITGAQRSSDRGSSDAFMNMICAFHAAAESDVAEVAVCMHTGSSDDTCSLMRGTKVRKMHTSRRDAFKPINARPIAKISVEGRIDYISEYKKIDAGKGRKVDLMTGFEPKVALVKFYPNSDPEILDYYVEKEYKGIIIEGTGLGHMAVNPTEAKYSWIAPLKKAVGKGVVVGITSQCLFGRVHTKVYSNLRIISNTGAIYCEDMLPEVALVKLGFLLGNYKTEEVKRMLNRNISGEITARTEVDWFV